MCINMAPGIDQNIELSMLNSDDGSASPNSEHIWKH